MDSYDDDVRDESITDDLTSYSVDDETQLQPEDSLVGTGTGDEDVLDAGLIAPDRPLGSDSWGTTAAEQAQEETIEQRLAQELPDDGGAYGHPTDHVAAAAGEGGSDDDWTGPADPRAGRLVAPDEGTRADEDAELVGTDVGIDGGAASAEEAAVHVIDTDRDGNGIPDDEDLAAELALEQVELAREARELGISERDLEE